MSISKEIAKQINEVHFGGNWTDSNLKDQLSDLSWEEANISVYSFNTIATLVFHMNYYITRAIHVLNGRPLLAKDIDSFNHVPINSPEAWKLAQQKIWEEARVLETLIETMPDEQLWKEFAEKKYGNYYRNLQVIIEHFHYHLGQIAFIKKIVKNEGRP